ncbi:MAG: Gfo/Idh/MocA family oxidoreductase [Proteobacteria bacterium]|nr:Gfo/Idh/MocA family oxidoreductase [Pseudomonadota bacterium]
MSQAKTAILIGAGNRGTTYASFASKNPERLAIVGVAEPVAERREKTVARHGITADRAFDTWEDILERPLMADGAIIATQDSMHVEPAVKALEKGYHVLLEKPMALTRDECRRMVDTANRTGMTLNVCHVLRYTEFFAAIKSIIEQGLIGDVITIYHAENVAYYHMAHSYVRGNWHRSDRTSPMILAKCCHDLDLMVWFAGSRPKHIGSMGGLHHFTRKNAPAGAPPRCTDGCPVANDCQYHAVDTYLHGKHMKLGLAKTETGFLSTAAKFMLRFPGLSKSIPGLSKYATWRLWPTDTITLDTSEEGIMKALREGPYGRCVYACDNDQVDHQETLVEFENGSTAVLKMHGHAEQEGRTLRIDGSLGTLRGKSGGGGRLEVHIHRTGEKIVYPVKTDLIGHAEGDAEIMENFVGVLKGEKGLTTADDSLLSHLMAFAAHEARTARKIVSF